MIYKILTWAILALLLFPTISQAYIDPGTGSFILQMIGAAILGGLFSLKIFWGKITTFFSKKTDDEPGDIS